METNMAEDESNKKLVEEADQREKHSRDQALKQSPDLNRSDPQEMDATNL